jgi:formylglycine-generating enzyme required for sulfatase activity
MTTPEETQEGLIPKGTSGLVPRMDRRLELVGRLMQEIQAKESNRDGAEVAAPETDDASKRLRRYRDGEERDFQIAPGVSIRMCWCPPGDFLMGSPTTEEGRNFEENQVKVILSNGFWMGKHQVTQAQWEAVMGTNPSSFKGANLPVEEVNWDDTQAFLDKLNARLVNDDGGRMVLPTEAQWEYAARAGSAGVYSGGRLDQVAWYGGNSGDTTHPVGKKKANSWGLQDMSGNIWEWCLDWHDVKLPGGVNPTGPNSGEFRVFRGGGWLDIADDCRVAARGNHYPSDSACFIGFRIVRSLVP